MDWLMLICWTAGCLAVEGFFSGSELALVSCDKLRLAQSAAQGKRGAQIATRLASRPDWLFSTTLLGQNLFIVANTVIVTLFIIKHLGREYEFLALLLSPLILIFGEAVPKAIFQQLADRLAPRMAPVILVFSYLCYPVIWFLSHLTMLLLGGVRGSLMSSQSVTHESLKLFIQGLESPEEPRRVLSLPLKNTLLRILDFSRHRVSQVMTPLVEVFSLREPKTVEEVLLSCVQERYTYIPIFEQRAHNIKGVIRRLDLLQAVDLKAPASQVIRTPLYVPESMNVKDLFLLLRQRQENFAVVVDEYGGAVGVVSLEDILEEIVGEIEDEYDSERQGWTLVDKSHYLVAGRIEIDELNDKLKWNLPKGSYETLAGFLLELAGTLPQTGTTLYYRHLTFHIRVATARTVEEVMVDVGKR